MSRKLNNPTTQQHRDYGATSSSTNLPDVNFSGFSPTEFVSLSEDIARNLTAVNSKWKQLEKILKVIGTPREQPSTREKVHNINVETNALVEVTSKDLQRLTSVVRRGDKQQKLQLEKLTTDFQAIVEKYSTTQKQISTAMRLSYAQMQSGQQQDEQAEIERAEMLQSQRQLEASLQFQHDVMVDRVRQIEQIEADVLDANAIMRTVSNLVHQQSENVGFIETNVENAATEVELGREELEKATQRRQSYRRKILILLAIAVIIGLIVTGIIVSKIHS